MKNIAGCGRGLAVARKKAQGQSWDHPVVCRLFWSSPPPRLVLVRRQISLLLLTCGEATGDVRITPSASIASLIILFEAPRGLTGPVRNRRTDGGASIIRTLRPRSSRNRGYEFFNTISYVWENKAFARFVSWNFVIVLAGFLLVFNCVMYLRIPGFWF